MTIIEILALVVLLLLVLCGFALHAHGMAFEWMHSSKNVMKLQNHYGAEGINAYVNYSDRTVEVSFHHKGQYYARSISFVNAMAYMEKTPKGGIKKLLVKKLK